MKVKKNQKNNGMSIYKFTMTPKHGEVRIQAATVSKDTDFELF